ncbi:hypothetical protein GCM10020331_054170 [Ectobacillus funiculus]
MKSMLKKKWNQLSLVKQIIIGLIIGIILAVTIPEAAKPVVIFRLFICRCFESYCTCAGTLLSYVGYRST